MEIKIEIEKNKIIESLHIMSAHLGKQLQAVDIVASCDDDLQRIEPMWYAAVTALSMLLVPYSHLTLEEDKVIYNLKMPANWKSEQLDNLVKHCEVYLQNALFANWLVYVSPENAQFYRALNNEGAASIEHILSLRRKPA
ncbi:MAG: hypothetical protein IKD40_01360 [Bacteroidaceae bacterium]|nr:hypothetical protein [Bacteroidaceae bacterium]